MAVIYIKPGGTKNATGSGDYASTAGNWDDDTNCYSTLAKVGWGATSGSPATYIADGDEVIFYSDTAAPVTHVIAYYPPVRQIQPAGTVTFKSKDGDADSCILSSSNAGEYDLMLDPDVTSTKYVWQDLTFTKSVTSTTVNKGNIMMRGQLAECTFTRCTFRDYTTAYATASNIALTGVFQSTLVRTITNRIIKFTDCTFKDMSLSYYSGGWLIYPESSGADTTDIIFDGTNTFNDLAITTSNAAGANGGFIRGNANTTITINDNFDVTNFTSTVIADGKANVGFIKAEGGLTGDGILTGTNMTVTGGDAVSCFVHCTNTFDLNEIHTTDCSTIWTTDSNGTSSCTFLAQSSSAVGIINKIKATRPRSKFGGAVYWSGGGSITLGALECTDAKVLSGAVYGGGDGDATINSGLITGTRQDATLLTNTGDTLATFYGADIFVLVNETSAVRSKTTILSNITILDGDTTSNNSVDIRDTDTTYNHTAVMNNCVLNSGNAIELHTQENAAISLDLTLNNCAIPTAEIDNNIGVGSGTFTNNNPITSDPQPNADGTLPEGSPLVGTGIRYWAGSANPVGVNGEPFSDLYTDIGSYQSTWSPFHPVNL